MARPLSLVLIGLLLAALVPALRIFIVALTVAGVIYLVGKQAQQDPGNDDR